MSVVYPGSEIYQFTHHVSDIFPEDTDETVTVTAGGTAHVFGAWAEVTDGVNTLSSKFATKSGHITGILIEETSRTDEIYLLEISYGASKIGIANSRFMKTTVFLDVSHQTRIRSFHIPPGETIYYRLKCVTALSTASIHFRYYLTD